MSPFLLALNLQVSTKEFVFRFDGKEAGTNVIRDLGNGVSESTSELDLQGLHISSKLTIESAEGKVTKIDFDEKMLQGTKTVRAATIKFANGKASFANGTGKPTEVSVVPTLPAFANFHPGFLAGLDLSKVSGPTTIKTFLLEGLTPVNLEFNAPASRNILFGGKATEAKVYPFKLATISASIALDSEGKLLGWVVPSQKISFELKGSEGLFVDPMAKYPELSQATYDTLIEDADIKLRDGVVTRATIYRPKKEGRYPAILARTPYGRKAASTSANFFASRSYVYVLQDVRGTGDSKGQFLPLETERADGYDTLDWIDNQAWCDGKIGMIGASYVGFVQWAAAVENHPSLKCIVPQVSPPGSAMWNLPYDAGTLLLMGDLWWMRIVDNPNGNGAMDAMAEMKNMKSLNTLPLSAIDEKMFGFTSKIYDRWLTKEGSKNWPTFDFENLIGKVKIPVLHISGWFDGDEIGTQRNWMLGRNAGKKNQWLIYGPWTHFFNTTTSLQDVKFGDHALLELDSLYLRWFDTWLKDKSVGLEKVSKVKFFVTGSNKWVETSDWPMPGSKEQVLKFDLASGKLTEKLSKATSKTYTFDPSKTKMGVDTLDLASQAGTMFMPKMLIKSSPIYLESEPLVEDTTVTGPMSIEFDFKSEAKDTDFFGDVWDMDEKGKAYPAFRGGKIRAAYVYGMDQPRALVAGKTYRAKLMIWDAAHTVKKGHRLVLRIKSENFPAAARNLGGMEPLATATKFFTQKNTIMSSPSSPAVFKFQVIPAQVVK